VTRNDSVSFAALFRGTDVACVTPGAYTTAPPCPDGVAVGTLVPSIVNFHCEGGWVPLTAFKPSQDLIGGDDQLHYVTNGGSAVPPSGPVPDYWLLFDNSRAGTSAALGVAVKDGGVVGVGYSCNDAATFRASLLPGSAGYLVPAKG